MLKRWHFDWLGCFSTDNRAAELVIIHLRNRISVILVYYYISLILKHQLGRTDFLAKIRFWLGLFGKGFKFDLGRKSTPKLWLEPESWDEKSVFFNLVCLYEELSMKGFVVLLLSFESKSIWILIEFWMLYACL